MPGLGQVDGVTLAPASCIMKPANRLDSMITLPLDAMLHLNAQRVPYCMLDLSNPQGMAKNNEQQMCHGAEIATSPMARNGTRVTKTELLRQPATAVMAERDGNPTMQIPMQGASVNHLWQKCD